MTGPVSRPAEGFRPDQVSRLAEAFRLVRDEGADAGVLYRRWFHVEVGVLRTWPAPAAYRAATLRSGAFESGWSVVAPASGWAAAVIVMRGGRQRLMAPPELVPADPRVLSPGPGDRVRVHPLVAAESGGFWHLWSVGWQRRAPERYRRVYLPIAPPGALEVVGRIAATAPPRHIWAMKALSGVHDGGRRDGAVLYLPSRAPLETGWVADAVAGVRPWCVERLPPFVAPLPSPAGTAELPWAGWAPDPGGGRSFGEEVCEAVAVAAASTGDADRFMDAALRAVAALPGMRSSPVARVRRPRR